MIIRKALFLLLLILLPTVSFGADTLDFGTLKATPATLQSITLAEGAVVPVSFGESVQLVATTYPKDLPVTWAVQSEGESEATATIDSSGLVTADPESGSGLVRVTASLQGGLPKEALVYIGCQSCSGGLCEKIPGNGFVQLSSIDIRLSLGKAENGMSAGDLLLKADDPLAILATPEALELSTLSKNVKAIYKEDRLSQIITPQSFIHIDQHSPFEYQIFFYHLSDKGMMHKGLYQVDHTATPIAVWQIQNPDETPDKLTNLYITEMRGSVKNIYEYNYDAEKKTWQLSSGNGLRLESRTERIDADNNRVVRTTISGPDKKQEPVSVTEEIFHTFAWGEEVIAEINDPDGARLTTTTSYYEEQGSGYSKVKSQIQPNGSWLRYTYNKDGRIIKKASPWLDVDINSPDNQVRAITNNYKPVHHSDNNQKRDKHRPRTVTESIKGIVVSKTLFVYATAVNGERTIITEQCASQQCRFGDQTNLRTVTTTHPVGIKGPEAGKLKSRLSATKQLTSYFYERGTFAASADPEKSIFTPGKGKAVRITIVQGTTKHPKGIPHYTTKKTSITDWLGNEVMEESFVKTETGYERIKWTFHSYNKTGRLIETLNSNQTRTETSWSCCGKATTTDIYGITTRKILDPLKRVSAQINESTGIATEFSYDAAGRRIASITKNGKLSLTQTSSYDRAGRLLQTTNQAGISTSYRKEKNKSTVTRPGGGTEITTTFVDGRIKSITGTAVIAREYEYGINPDGGQWTKVFIGSKNKNKSNDKTSPRWEKTYRDLMGRIFLIEKPGFKGIDVTRNCYNINGQFIRTLSPGKALTIYVYDELGRVVRSGMDVNGNNILDLASTDRIRQNQSRYIKQNNIWWLHQGNGVIAEPNSDKQTRVSSTLVRLTGWDGKIVSETVVRDIHNQDTVSAEFLDRHKQTRIRTIKYPDSNIVAEQVFHNNRLVASQSKTGVQHVYGYDGLGRRTTVINERTGPTITHFNDKGQVDYIQDATRNRTRFSYDSNTGQKIAVINGHGKATRYSYNQQGQLTRTWGDVPYPVEYHYNNFGEKVLMRTFRKGEKWNQEQWPKQDKNTTADETRWQYQPATGLLLSKTDAKGNSVNYTYKPGGRLDTRTWARGITTTYSYSSITGELTTIDYSDTTPDISYIYDRLGRKTQINDGFGVHHFNYNNKLQLISEGITGKLFSSLTRNYDAMGRSSGFKLDNGYTVTYGYDKVGRFKNLAWDIAGITGKVDYGYLKDSDLISGLSFDNDKKKGKNKKIQVAYTYETNRNLRTSITNTAGDTLISKYEYQYDRLGRRMSVSNSGSGFNKPDFTFYDYNHRNELQSSQSFAGKDVGDQTEPLTARDRYYQFDPIGNRTKVLNGKTWTNYVANELNQYTAISGPKPAAPEFDVDGNMIEFRKNSVTTKYIYNGENGLVLVEPHILVADSIKSEFVYDFQGRRRVKKVSRYKSGKWQLDSEKYFLYDGWNMVAEVDSLTKKQINYVWGLDLSQSLQGAGGVGGLLTRVDMATDKALFYLYEGNGNVSQLVDVGDGSLVTIYQYDPYGKIIYSEGEYAEVNPFRFSTKYFDSETELYYYGYRYYSSELGRWINRDPIGERGGLGLYNFTSNNPISLVDPLGHKAYTAYRELGLTGGNFLWSLLKSAGHVYLAFKVSGSGLTTEEEKKWCDFLTSKGFKYSETPTKNAKEYNEWITFSYHPISVKNGTGDLFGTLITLDSFIDLNNPLADLAPIVLGDASKNLISGNFEDEKRLFERALISLADKGHGFSRKLGVDIRYILKTYQNYGFLRYNCGGWAKYIVDQSGLSWPLGSYFYNLGVGVDGPLHYPALAIDTVVRSGYQVYDNVEVVTFSSHDPSNDPQQFIGLNFDF